MNALVPLADIISTIAFAASAVLVLLARPAKRGVFDTWSRGFLFAAMALYAMVGVSNTLEHLGVTAALDVYEDYMELLFVPLLAYAAHQAYMRSLLNERGRAFWALDRQHEMMLSVIDTVPCGIVIVDDTGRVTFANSAARRILMVSEDASTGTQRPADWVAVDADGSPQGSGEPGRLPAIASVTGSDVTQRILWPDGETTVLSVSSTTMLSQGGAPGGSVVAFEVVGVER